MSFRRAAAVLVLLAAPAAAEQRLPDCARLNALWLSNIRPALKPDWPARDLACGTPAAQLGADEIRDLATAEAGYYLGWTEWTSRALPGGPLVVGGGISAPPPMLEWVSRRITALRYDDKASSAYAETGDGSIHLTPSDFKLGNGMGLAGQLIHESRHIGIPAYGHVACTVPGQGGPNCDPTIAEDFQGGGSHAIAAIWLAWIANRSRWPAAERKTAEKVAVWVMTYRINDLQAADAFTCRYFGYYLRERRKACSGYR